MNHVFEEQVLFSFHFMARDFLICSECVDRRGLECLRLVIFWMLGLVVDFLGGWLFLEDLRHVCHSIAASRKCLSGYLSVSCAHRHVSTGKISWA